MTSVSCKLGLQNTHAAFQCWLAAAASSSCIPSVWLVVHVHVGMFTVCSNLLQNKVTQQNTDCGNVSDGSSNRMIFSDSACVSDGRYIRDVLKLKLLNRQSEEALHKFTGVNIHCRFTSEQDGR